MFNIIIALSIYFGVIAVYAMLRQSNTITAPKETIMVSRPETEFEKFRRYAVLMGMSFDDVKIGTGYLSIQKGYKKIVYSDMMINRKEDIGNIVLETNVKIKTKRGYHYDVAEMSEECLFLDTRSGAIVHETPKSIKCLDIKIQYVEKNKPVKKKNKRTKCKQ